MPLPDQPNDYRTSLSLLKRLPTGRFRRQCGFTLVEVMVVTTMTAFLSMMVAGIWSGLLRSTTDTMTQSRLVSDAQFALESLRRDLAGSVPEERSGTKLEGMIVGTLATADDRLLLCFDAEPLNEIADWAAPDRVIVYEVQNGQLIRTDQQSGTSFVVVDNVSNFGVTQLVSGVRIELTIERGKFNRTYTLISQDP